MRQLSEAGIPTTVMVAPIIPGLTDHEIERILEAAKAAGARSAGYVLLRLPLEIKDAVPRMAARANSPTAPTASSQLLQSMHGGRDYTSEFGVRQRGTGPYAEQIAHALPAGDEAARA